MDLCWRALAWGEVRGTTAWADGRVPGEQTSPRTPRAADDRPAVSTDCRCTAAMETN